MTEQELASVVVDWLTGQYWDVYQEVEFSRGGQISDIVAVRNKIMMIVEVKKSLGIAVISQAHRRLSRSNFISVAVPERKERTYSINHDREFAYRICKDYGIGVLEISQCRTIKEVVSGRLFRDKHGLVKDYMERLHDGHKTYAKAGSTTGGRWTPYRNTMDTVKSILIENGPLTMKQLMEFLTSDIYHHHYSTDKSALTCIRKALTLWEDWAQYEVGGKGEFIFSVKPSS